MCIAASRDQRRLIYCKAFFSGLSIFAYCLFQIVCFASPLTIRWIFFRIYRSILLSMILFLIEIAIFILPSANCKKSKRMPNERAATLSSCLNANYEQMLLRMWRKLYALEYKMCALKLKHRYFFFLCILSWLWIKCEHSRDTILCLLSFPSTPIFQKRSLLNCSWHLSQMFTMLQ